MRWRVPAAISVALAPLLALACTSAAFPACTVLTEVDGLTGGAATSDGAVEAMTIPRVPDGGVESGSPEASADGSDAGATRSQLYAAAVLSDKPLAYWRLDETSGTVAKDETGKFNGTYFGATLGQPGVAGSVGIKLPTSSSARMAIESPAFRFPGVAPYSVEAWVVPGSFKNYQWISGTETNVSGLRSGWSVFTTATGTVHYEVWNGDGDGGAKVVRGLFFPTDQQLSVGRLTHVVFTFNGTRVTGYLDGARGPGVNATAPQPDVGRLLWGCRGDLNHCLDGWSLDELAIYDFALDEARVQTHYLLGK